MISGRTTAAATPAAKPPKLRRSTSSPASLLVSSGLSPRVASGSPISTGAKASRGISTISAKRNSSRMSKRVSRWPFSIRLTVLWDQPMMSATSCCDSPETIRKIANAAPGSSRASACRIGWESHSHVGVTLSRSRAARVQVAHTVPVLNRDSRVVRHTEHTRGAAISPPDPEPPCLTGRSTARNANVSYPRRAAP